nr:DUF2335 domain-containing protein [Rhodococcus rhodochrous]
MDEDGAGTPRVDEAGGVVQVTEGEIVDAIEESAPAIARRVTSRHSVHIRQEGWSGPLPRPSDLAEYEAILPGLANRIVAMAETTVDTQSVVERTLATGDVEAVRRGQYLSSAIVVACVAGAIIAAVNDLPWASIGFLVPAVVQFAPKLIRSVREPLRPDPVEERSTDAEEHDESPPDSQ